MSRPAKSWGCHSPKSRSSATGARKPTASNCCADFSRDWVSGFLVVVLEDQPDGSRGRIDIVEAPGHESQREFAPSPGM
jgi:hypothetical protein